MSQKEKLKLLILYCEAFGATFTKAESQIIIKRLKQLGVTNITTGYGEIKLC